MSKLEQVAASMRQTLAGSQARFVHRRLQRGLEVVLERREERLSNTVGCLHGLIGLLVVGGGAAVGGM